MVSTVHHLPYREVIGGKTDGDYLVRYHITPMPWWPKAWPRIYLHIFARPDADRDLHDHPWGFTTICLWGGYREVSHVKDHHDRPTGARIDDKLTFLSIRKRPATHAHRITELLSRRVVTLVFRDHKRQRDWGFWTTDARGQFKWVQWQEYLGLPERTYEAY